MKFILLLLFSIYSLNAALVIKDNNNIYENFNIKYLYDENSSLTIQEIQHKEFLDTIDSQFTQGYKYGNAWFKLEFDNQTSNEEFVLNFTEPTWSTLNLYSRQNSLWKIEKNGLDIPLKKRDIQNATPAFHIHLKTGEITTLYVKGNTIASQIGEFQLFTQKEFFNPSRITLLEWYTIYAFVLFAFILLNTYNYIVTRENIYAYYIVYVFIYIIFSSMHSGTYITFGFANWNEGLHVLGVLTLFSLLLFSIEFLELKTTYPLMKKVFRILAIGSLIFAFLLSEDIPYATIASNIYFSAVLIFIVIIALKVLKNGFCGAKYYLLALMLYLPSMAMMAMNFNTILPNTNITRYSFLIGAFIEMFLFTLILTNRYKEVNKEKIIAQNKLLEEKQNTEDYLISEINKKTNHLTVVNEKLMQQAQELEDTKKQLTIDATTDMLSNLYNRRYFFEASLKCFHTAIRYKHTLSILMLDVDKFKNINDTYGHTAGDQVIISVANLLKKFSRNSDIIARYGGEEFIILLPNTAIEQAVSLAEKIRIELQKIDILLPNNEIINVTISIGATELNYETDLSIQETIARSDKALYKAKESGRNRVCYL